MSFWILTEGQIHPSGGTHSVHMSQESAYDIERAEGQKGREPNTEVTSTEEKKSKMAAKTKGLFLFFFSVYFASSYGVKVFPRSAWVPE